VVRGRQKTTTHGPSEEKKSWKGRKEVRSYYARKKSGCVDYGGGRGKQYRVIRGFRGVGDPWNREQK